MDIALSNYEFLRNLRPHKKVMVDSSGRLCYDNRWGQSIRRSYTGDSRQNLLQNIENTFTTLSNSNPLNSEDEQSVLRHVSDVLKKTYPSYSDLHGENGILAKLLERSRMHEAQRKAQELLLEKSSSKFPNRNELFEPSLQPNPQQHSTPMPPNIHNIKPVNLNDFILDLNTSMSNMNVNMNDTTTRKPIVHDILDFDEHEKPTGCCGCIKRKQK